MKKIYIVIACHENEMGNIISKFIYAGFSTMEKAKKFIEMEKQVDLNSEETNWIYYIDEVEIDKLQF